MENPKRVQHFKEKTQFWFSHLQEGVLEILRDPGFWLPLQIGTWLAPGPILRLSPWRLLTPLFVWILLEVNLGLGPLRSKDALTTSSVLEPTQGNPTPLSLL